MSRRSRRHVRVKERRPPARAQSLLRNLRSSKNIILRKRKTDLIKLTKKTKCVKKIIKRRVVVSKEKPDNQDSNSTKVPENKSDATTSSNSELENKTSVEVDCDVEQGNKNNAVEIEQPEVKEESCTLLPNVELEDAVNEDAKKDEIIDEIDNNSMPVDTSEISKEDEMAVELADNPKETGTETLEESAQIQPSPTICTVCNKTVESESSLAQHMKQHAPTNQVHQCSICSKSLSSASSLDRHMLVHSGERPFKCKLCDMSFTTNGNMHRHMRTHGELVDTLDGTKSIDLRKRDSSKTKLSHDASLSSRSASLESLQDQEKFYCPVCGKAFLSNDVLKNHMSLHPNDPILCQKCGKISVNYSTHEDHKCNILRSNLPGTCYHSTSCGFRDLTFMDFTSNKFSLASKSFCEQNIKHPSSAFHVFQCSECNKAFPCGRALKLHQNTHDSKVGTFCPSCHCDFAASSFLKLHQLKHRSPEHCLKNTINPDFDDQMQLAHQPQIRADKEDFLALLNLQTKQSQMSMLKSIDSCNVKEDDFENFDYFVHGKVIKSESQPNVDACNNNIANVNNNDFADIQSIISLTSKAPLISSGRTSPIAVRSASPLPFVTMSHPDSPQVADTASASPETPSKDETISICNKEHAAEADSLTISPYSCKICAQKFKTVNTFKKHCKLHVQRGSNYSCHLCSYVSVDKSTLIRHLRTHNGERPFQCVICKYAFTTKANCERHVRKRHKKFGKAEIRNAMQYNPNMSLRTSDSSVSEISNSETVCKYCGVNFKFNRVLRHHLRSLHNSCNRKPFSCKICKFGFSTKNNCIRHVLKQHPNLKDKLRSVVIPNSQMQISSNEMSETESSSSSTANQPSADQNQPLDLHCDSGDQPSFSKPSDSRIEFSSDETVTAAQSLVSLSEAPALQDEPLDLAAHPLDLTCKPLAATMKRIEPKPASIYNNEAHTPKTSDNDSIDLSVPIALPLLANKTQIQPVPLTPLNYSSETHESTLPKNNSMINGSSQKLRSFTCVYCNAGFTLKSNMERHIKRKHPEYARPTRSRNFIPSIIASNIQKQNSTTLSDKTRDALRHVLSNKVHQVTACKDPSMVVDKALLASTSHNFCESIQRVVNCSPTVNLSLDLSGKNKNINIISFNSKNVLNLSDHNGEENCSDLASVSSVICTANSQQFKQYLKKSTHFEKVDLIQKTVKPSEEDNKEIQSVKKSNESPSVSCPFCARKFPWTSSLRRHILTHTGQKPYKCPKCSLWFTTKSNCERHLIRKHGHKGDLITRSVPDRPYKCNHCLTSTFSTQGNLRKHFYLKHWTKSYLGMNCKAVHNDAKAPENTSEKNTVVENKSDHNQTVAIVATQEHSYSQLNKKMNFKCFFCEKSYEDLSSLSSHMTLHSNVSYMCYLCRKIYAKHDGCYNHFKTSHSLVYQQLTQYDGNVSENNDTDDDSSRLVIDIPPLKNNPSNMACMICFQKMQSYEDLQKHFKTHLKEKQPPISIETENQPTASEQEIVSDTVTVPVTDSSSSNKRVRATKNKVKNSLLYLFTPSSSSSPSIVVPKSANQRMEIPTAEDGSDLIQNLLGIHDSKMIDEMLVSADSAARLLGVKKV